MRYQWQIQSDWPSSFKYQLLEWSRQYTVHCFLDSNDWQQDSYSQYDFILAAGAEDELLIDDVLTGTNGTGPSKGGDTRAATTTADLPPSPFEQAEAFSTDAWAFGFFSFESNQDYAAVKGNKVDEIELPLLHFFKPKILFRKKGRLLFVDSSEEIDVSQLLIEIQAIEIKDSNFTASENERLVTCSDLVSRISKDEYCAQLEKIQEAIAAGTFYELNFCQEFYWKHFDADAHRLFYSINEDHRAPFSSFYRLEDKYALCFSPERFLQKRANHVISQPIKGTRKRGVNLDEDLALAKELRTDEKEIAENIMCVDLVRNDLNRSCVAGTVEVTELNKLYSFEKVHHLVSTIRGLKKERVPTADLIANAFPMGSMTGAPKSRVMKFIADLEASKRGLYSGSIGYFTPEGDFDSNVVIRTLVYNSEKKYASLQAGGAITSKSIPENEYVESRLKIEAIVNHIKKLSL